MKSTWLKREATYQHISFQILQLNAFWQMLFFQYLRRQLTQAEEINLDFTKGLLQGKYWKSEPPFGLLKTLIDKYHQHW